MQIKSLKSTHISLPNYRSKVMNIIIIQYTLIQLMSDKIFDNVKESYGNIAKLELKNNNETSNCCGDVQINSGCCGEEVLSLGCYNNLVERAELRKGEILLDLGSGPGHDLLKAVEILGSTGLAIGVDMTKEMIELGRRNTSQFENITIIEGNLQNIPLDDNYVDVIISNCVFNLAPDKLKAYSEALRVLKKGGRMVIADVALDYELDERERSIQQVYSGCIGGAVSINENIEYIKKAGFIDIKAEIQHSGNYLLNNKEYEYKSVLFSGIKK